MLAETLIDEVRGMDEAKITNISDLKNSIGTFETNAKTLMEEK